MSLEPGTDVFPTNITLPDDGQSRAVADVNPALEGLADRTKWLANRLPRIKGVSNGSEVVFFGGGHSGRPTKQVILTLALPDLPPDSAIAFSASLWCKFAGFVTGGDIHVAPQIDLTFDEGGPFTSGDWDSIGFGTNPNGFPISSSAHWVANVVAATYPTGISNVVAELAFTWLGNAADDDASLIIPARNASLIASIGRRIP